MSFVLDNSIAMGWCMPDERTTEVMALLEIAQQTKLFVPAVWPLEFANALRSGYKKQRIDRTGVEAAFSLMQALDISVLAGGQQWMSGINFDLMLQHDLTSYDLSYLSLAMELRLPLATLDSKLAEAARLSGVSRLP